MAMNFNKGISIVSGFSLGAKTPLDIRYAVATIADRDAHVTNNRAYEGMLDYVEATKTIYKYNGTSWDAFGVTTNTTVSVSGDVNNTSFTTGVSSSAELALTLKDIATAGTGCKITINSKGLVTGVADLEEADIPTLHLAKIEDAGTAAAKDAALSGAGKVALIGEDGKLSTDIIPALALTEVFVVEDETEMLALAAQPGDIAVRNDESRSYILKQVPASTAGNWVELKTPADKVQSVNGKTGAVVLNTDNIAEGSTNLYYTDARATANFNTNFAGARSTDLADTADIFYKTDNLPATQVVEDTTHRFVTDDDKTLWNSSAHIIVGNDASSAVATMNTGDFYYEISA
jgi:hypothetical protein